MKLDNSILIQSARSSQKGSSLFLEIIKAILFLTVSSMITDTSFVIVVEELMAVQDETVLSLFYLYWQIIAIGLFALFANLIQRRPLGFKAGHALSQYLQGSIIGTGMIVGVVLIGSIVGAFSFHGLSNWSDPQLIFLFLGGYVIQGMAEEVICRGYILLSIARRNKVWTAIFFSSIIFSIMHINNTGFGIIPAINLFLFAAFESIYYLKTNNIYGISAIHTTWNFIQGCVLGFGVSGENLMPSIFRFSCSEIKILSGGEFGPEGGLVVSLVVVGSIILLIRHKSEECHSVQPHTD